MKKIGLLAIAAILGVSALLAGQSLAVEVGLSDIQASAARDCASFKALLSKYQTNLAGSSDEYDALKEDIKLWRGYTSHDFATLPAKKSSLKTKIDGLYTTADGYCNTIKNATEVTIAQTAYNSLKTEKNKTNLIKLIDKLNDYYGKYQELVDNVEYNLAFRGINEFTSRLGEGKFSQENAYLTGEKGIIQRIEKKSDSLVDVPDILTIFDSPTDSAVNGLDYKLRKQKSDLDSLNKEFARNAMPAMENVLIDAAQDGVSVTIDKSDKLKNDYKELSDYYSAKAVKDKQGLQRKITGEKGVLASYTKKLALTKSLNNLSSALADKLKGSPAWLAANANSPLIKAETGLNAAVSYADVAAKALADKNAMIKEFYIKNFDLAIKFNSGYGKAKESQGACQRFDDNFNLLKSGLTKSEDLTQLDSLKSSLEQPCLNINTLAATTLISQIETAIGNINDSDAPTSTAINSLGALISNYNKDLAEASRRISPARRDWWKLIETAVKAGEAGFRSGFADSTLDDEQKAAKLYQSFEEKRDQYREKARKMIDSRKLTLQNNQLVMNDATLVAAAAPALKNAFGTKLSALLGTGEEGLEDYYNEMAAQNNYNDLKALAGDLKPTFMLNEVVIPLQKMYLNLDSYYGKYANLNSIADLLNSRAGELTNKTDAITASQASITGLLGDLNTALAALSGDMKEMLEGKIDEASQTELRSSLQPQEKEIKSLISKLAREERTLLSLVKAAEKAALETPAE